MTLLRTAMFMRLKVNGTTAIKSMDKIEIHKGIAQVIQHLNQSPIQSRGLSSIQIEFSKREILDDIDPELQSMLDAAGNDVVYVHDSDLVPNTPITWGRWNELMDSSTWRNALTLATTKNYSGYTENEMKSIKFAFESEFQGTPEGDFLGAKLNAV